MQELQQALGLGQPIVSPAAGRAPGPAHRGGAKGWHHGPLRRPGSSDRAVARGGAPHLQQPAGRYPRTCSATCSASGVGGSRVLLFWKMLKVGLATEPLGPGEEGVVHLLREVDSRARRLFGRALAIREVDAGSCNGCEIEITGLTSPVYDMERFGIHFVASPRHADLLLVTGPVTAQHGGAAPENLRGNARTRSSSSPSATARAPAASSRGATPSRAASIRSSRSTCSWTAARPSPPTSCAAS